MRTRSHTASRSMWTRARCACHPLARCEFAHTPSGHNRAGHTEPGRLGQRRRLQPAYGRFWCSWLCWLNTTDCCRLKWKRRRILTTFADARTVYRLCSQHVITTLGERFTTSRCSGVCHRTGYRDLFCKAAVSTNRFAGNHIPARGTLGSIDACVVASMALVSDKSGCRFYHQIRNSTRFHEPAVLHVIAYHSLRHCRGD